MQRILLPKQSQSQLAHKNRRDRQHKTESISTSKSASTSTAVFCITFHLTLYTIHGVISNTKPWFWLPPVLVVPKIFPSLSTATLPYG
jgi:hypothetical protein